MRNMTKYGIKLKFTVGPIPDDKHILAKLKIFKNKNLTTFNNTLCKPSNSFDIATIAPTKQIRYRNLQNFFLKSREL